MGDGRNIFHNSVRNSGEAEKESDVLREWGIIKKGPTGWTL